jgi:serine/threonine-protein kinase RsbW
MDDMTALPASLPPGEAVELGRWTVENYQGLRHLRMALRDAVSEFAPASASAAAPAAPASDDEDDDVPERIAVVATELATNALRHGRPPAEVRLLRVDDLLVVDACDHDPDGEPRFDTERPLGQGGLGLLLARTFALEIGWYRDGEAKHVWASFPALYSA